MTAVPGTTLPTMPTCERCGTTFSLPEGLQERYPGWEPRYCRACWRATNGGGGGGGGGKTGSTSSGKGSGRRGGGRRAATLREENLTVVEVLETYTAGPDTGVFTDGSAVPNPGPGGWGAVYVRGGDVIAQDHGHDPDTTNNRMELTALIRGIDLVPEGTPATIHSDSRLVVNTVNEWAASWEKRGWKRKSGPIKNLDLVKEAYAKVRARPEIEVVWIKAHDGSRWNEYADSLATAWMRDEL